MKMEIQRMSRKMGGRIPWMPVTFFVLALVSIGMLLWANRINERQRVNFTLAKALLDAEVKVATFHLWFEEALMGEKTLTMDEIWSGFDQGASLLAVILNGATPCTG